MANGDRLIAEDGPAVMELVSSSPSISIASAHLSAVDRPAESRAVQPIAIAELFNTGQLGRQAGNQSFDLAAHSAAGTEPAADPYLAILNSSGFLALPGEQQQAFLSLRDGALSLTKSTDERQAVDAALMAFLKSSSKGGQPVLLSTDINGGTLLHNLERIINGPVHPVLDGRRLEMLRSLSDEITNTNNRMGQGLAYTSCVATSIALKYARDYRPADYARIIADLASEGTAALAGGHSLSFSQWSVCERALIGRSLTESMFQTSLGNMVGAFADGVYPDQFETICEAVFGTAFERVDCDDMSRLVSDLRRTLKDDGVALVSMQTDLNGNHANHALLVEKIEGNRVYFRNPWGREYDNPGALDAAHVEGDDQLFCMTLENFKKRVNFVMLSSSEAEMGVTPGYERPEGYERTFFPGVAMLLEPDSKKQEQGPQKTHALDERRAPVTQERIYKTVGDPPPARASKAADAPARAHSPAMEEPTRKVRRILEDDWIPQ